MRASSRPPGRHKRCTDLGRRLRGRFAPETWHAYRASPWDGGGRQTPRMHGEGQSAKPEGRAASRGRRRLHAARAATHLITEKASRERQLKAPERGRARHPNGLNATATLKANDPAKGLDFGYAADKAWWATPTGIGQGAARPTYDRGNSCTRTAAATTTRERRRGPPVLIRHQLTIWRGLEGQDEGARHSVRDIDEPIPGGPVPSQGRETSDDEGLQAKSHHGATMWKQMPKKWPPVTTRRGATFVARLARYVHEYTKRKQ